MAAVQSARGGAPRLGAAVAGQARVGGGARGRRRDAASAARTRAATAMPTAIAGSIHGRAAPPLPALACGPVGVSATWSGCAPAFVANGTVVGAKPVATVRASYVPSGSDVANSPWAFVTNVRSSGRLSSVVP